MTLDFGSARPRNEAAEKEDIVVHIAIQLVLSLIAGVVIGRILWHFVTKRTPKSGKLQTLDGYIEAFNYEPDGERATLIAKLTQWQQEGYAEAAYGGGSSYAEKYRLQVSVRAWVAFKESEVVIYSRTRTWDGNFNTTSDWEERKYTAEEFTKWKAHHKLYPRIQLSELLSQIGDPTEP